MMGTVEFNSACLLSVPVIDWEKLVENLQDDAELAKAGVRAFLDGFVVANQPENQNTFAAHNPPEFVAITVRKGGAPRSLANAFEVPVRASKSQSVTRESAKKLAAKSGALDSFLGPI